MLQPTSNKQVHHSTVYSTQCLPRTERTARRRPEMERTTHQEDSVRCARWREASHTPAVSASSACVCVPLNGEIMVAERRDISSIAVDVEESFTLWSCPEKRFFIMLIRTISPKTPKPKRETRTLPDSGRTMNSYQMNMKLRMYFESAGSKSWRASGLGGLCLVSRWKSRDR